MSAAKNNTKVKIVTALFVIVSLCDLAGIIFHLNQLRFVFKPLLMLTLLLLYLVSERNFNGWYIGALVFSFFGDVLLLFEGEIYFILGLISFLLAHIIYIKIVLCWLNKTSLKTKAVAAIPFLILFFVLINLLKNNLNDLFIPVVVYGITIAIMGYVSLLNYLNNKSLSALFMVVGASLFIISDSVLAINKFYSTNEFFPIVIMLTYLMAQYLIFKAVIAQNIENC
ncbi:lysoplasmalogenase [Aureibaculum conchae]|uniref:lysoplasmalogenase n=1 Tax=Aureibaculum sp. 2308TA14-22 TaxID=3108392 RepID=UPI0033969ED6